MPTPTKIDIRAVAFGLVMLPLVYVVGSLLGNLILHHPSDDPGLWSIMAPIFGALLWLLPGFTTGYIAKRLPLLHGLVLGLGSVLLALVILGTMEIVFRYSDSLPMALVIGFLVPIFLGSFVGTLLGHFVGTRRKAP